MYLIDPSGLKEIALIFPENTGSKKKSQTTDEYQNWQKKERSQFKIEGRGTKYV